jgi:hypothetical protein
MVTSLTGSGPPSNTLSLIPPEWIAPGVPDNLIYPNDDGLGFAGSGFVDSAGIGMLLSVQGNPDAQVVFYTTPLGTEFAFFSGAGLNDVGLFTLSAVPEPANWMLMLVALGSLGTSLRVRRRYRLALGAPFAG